MVGKLASLFSFSKLEEEGDNGHNTPNKGSKRIPDLTHSIYGADDKPFMVDMKEMSGYEKNLYLYSEEMADRPRVSMMINSLANYNATIPSAEENDSKPTKPVAKLGTLMGVFLPCIQNIFGVILFIRMPWIVGTAGGAFAFTIVLMCCCTVSKYCLMF
ncbi:Solute carrier family 12 member 6-like 1 [Homarus americanus]|uniref:Solute carrier family 12 member 6-like 1 n=1 Tax=Homarus americanus TaxID=6706 RepID=A0A8J5JYL9_HOMAM|nr:Solute carrier family 12 member 6-like 1 [Homarus americanus]